MAWHRGAVRPIEACTVSILDRGVLFAESLYEVLPIVDRRLCFIEEHAQRFGVGAEALALPGGAPSRDTIVAIGEALLSRTAVEEGTLYLQLTGGAGPRSHVPAGRPQPELFAFVQPLRFPRADAQATPLRVGTAPDPRWARCDLKTTMLLPAVLARRAAPHADEVIFFDARDRLTEGGSTCVFVVERDRVVMPPLSPRLLPSVTRGVMERAAADAGIALVHDEVPRARLVAADEVGVASTTKLVLPVGEVDGAAVAVRRDGVCARLAALLRERYGLGG
ncbi:MAG: aminotransferase class IV [Myxococcota bacterium]